MNIWLAPKRMFSLFDHEPPLIPCECRADRPCADDSTNRQKIMHEAAADAMPQDQRWSICVQYDKQCFHAQMEHFWPACIMLKSVPTKVMVQYTLSHQSGPNVASGNSHDGCRLPVLGICI